MTFIHLANLMQNWGYEIDMKHYYQFKYYLEEMLKKNRVMIVRRNGLIEAVIIYYLTHDYTKIYKKPMWRVTEDSEDGSQVYIDKMVCRKWTRTAREDIGRALQEHFPNAKEVIYHRAPKDRCVKIRRRSEYEPVSSAVC